MKKYFEASPERIQSLAGVTRYDNFSVMLYRTNLVTHTRRIAHLLQALEPYAIHAFGKAWDTQKAIALGLVHDDPEIIMGDYQAGDKAKMTPQQLAIIRDEEQKAIDQIVKRFPKMFGPYDYHKLLIEATDKKTIEAQVMKFVDKFDAFGEALHEIFAGNVLFTQNIINQYGTIDTPYDYYLEYIAGFTKQFPQTKPFFTHDFPFPIPPQKIDFKKIASRGKPHSPLSIMTPTNYKPYDFWKTTIITHGTDADRAELYTQKEHI